MRKVYITSYRFLAADDASRTLMAPDTSHRSILQEDSVEVTSESLQSKPFPKYAAFIMVKADAPCSLAFGADPVASPEYHFMEAGELRYYGVQPDERLAVISNEGI